MNEDKSMGRKLDLCGYKLAEFVYNLNSAFISKFSKTFKPDLKS